MKPGDLAACPLAGHIVLEWIDASCKSVRMGRKNIGSSVRPGRHAGRTETVSAHGDLVLTDDAAILSRLGDSRPEAALLGDGTPQGRAEAMHWLEFLASDVRKAFLPIIDASHFCGQETRGGMPAEGARQRLRAHLEQIDAQLAGRTWLVGARSVADAFLFVILCWAADMDISLSGLHHLMRYARRMEDDPGVQAAILYQESVPARTRPTTVHHQTA